MNGIKWFWSNESCHWAQKQYSEAPAHSDARLELDGREYQKMLGFGGCFNELGWRALSYLDGDSRNKILDELFSDRAAPIFPYAGCLSEQTTTPSIGTVWTRPPGTMSLRIFH